MTDRVLLQGVLVEGRHGVGDDERGRPQPFSVDVELELDLRPAGRADDLALTADYAAADALVRRVVATTSFRLLEALAEAIATELLAATPATTVVVRLRKPAVALGGPFESAGIEIRRARQV